MKDIKRYLRQAQKGLDSLSVGNKYKQTALESLELWLRKPEFSDYLPQIKHLIDQGYWNYLLDSFYQIIPFGTGGRRGEVGIGPNRINPWTIQASAQGHSQYLLKHYGEGAKQRGVVFTYDVREFFTNKYFSDNLPNPVRNLNCKDLAIAAAEVYTANGLKVHMFDDIRTTPELSFAIRHLNAVAGDMFSASHNPPEHNGKKVYDEFGGQLIPPYDQELVDEVTLNVKEIRTIPYQSAVKEHLIVPIPKEVDLAYIEAAAHNSLSKARDIKILYTPLHGCGLTSVPKVLHHLGFQIKNDPKTSNPSGKFENVTFNIPNPEVRESFDTTLETAKNSEIDLILNSDPDADRIGIMLQHKQKWVFLNGNEIAAILAEYATQKRKTARDGNGVMIKTSVTTNLITEICRQNNFEIIGDLLVGFKYIATEMNKLEEEGKIKTFLFACEESHGYLAGNYARDKDACVPAIWLSELAAELKVKNETLVDYLDNVYAKYGYFRNYLTEIRMLGAVGHENIRKIQDELRKNPPTSIDNFDILEFEDCQQRKPIVSETDMISKDVLIFRLKPVKETSTIKITVRPSGTEPKIKMYFEIGTPACERGQLNRLKEKTEAILANLEKSFMKYCYQIISVNFPDRGFKLFWQLPLDDKLKYFEIEPEIAELKNLSDPKQRKQKLFELIEFLGSDPVEKVDHAFVDKYGSSIAEYLDLNLATD